MTTAGTPTGKLHPVAKWALIIGPILVVVFNFLLPTNGIDPINPENSQEYIAELGDDADLAQIYIIVILAGIVLFTRAIIGLHLVAPEGAARQRLGIGMLGAVAALGLWGIVLGLGLAEASVARNVVDATAAAGAGVAGMAEKAASATLVATALHAAFFGVFQIAIYVAFVSLIPIGGGLAVSGIVRREFGWAIVAIGIVALVVVSVLPIKTEEGFAAFGIVSLVWGVVFLVMGLQIVRQDWNESTVSAESSE